MEPALVNLSIRRGVTFPGFTVTCKDAAGAVVALAGWSAVAQIRNAEDDSLIYNLAPVIATDDSAGVITVPEIAWAVTAALPAGDFVYDLIPQDAAGKRYDPIITGRVTIGKTISHD